MRFPNRLSTDEFNRRVEELVEKFSILHKDAIHIVRDFEHSYYLNQEDAVKDFKVKIKDAQKTARRKLEKTSFSEGSFPQA